MTIDELVSKLTAGGHLAVLDTLCQTCRVRVVRDRHYALLTSLCETVTQENFEQRAPSYAQEVMIASMLDGAAACVDGHPCACANNDKIH